MDKDGRKDGLWLRARLELNGKSMTVISSRLKFPPRAIMLPYDVTL